MHADTKASLASGSISKMGSSRIKTVIIIIPENVVILRLFICLVISYLFI